MVNFLCCQKPDRVPSQLWHSTVGWSLHEAIFANIFLLTNPIFKIWHVLSTFYNQCFAALIFFVLVLPELNYDLACMTWWSEIWCEIRRGLLSQYVFFTQSQYFYLFSAVLGKISSKSNGPSMIGSISMIFPSNIWYIHLDLQFRGDICFCVFNLPWLECTEIIAFSLYSLLLSSSLTARDIEIDFAMLWTAIATQY